jgi:hypothetical protein
MNFWNTMRFLQASFFFFWDAELNPINAQIDQKTLFWTLGFSGFTPGPEGIDALIYSIKKIKATSPNVAYLVDPVMGVRVLLYQRTLLFFDRSQFEPRPY